MSKIVLDNVTNSNNITKINENFSKIETELQDRVLYRDNPIGEPNSVDNNIDMNGNTLFNIGNLDVNGISINGVAIVPTGTVVSPIPNPTGQTGKFLKSDGVTSVWQLITNSDLGSLTVSSASSLIGWIQEGTGAVLRTIQDKLRERISVKDFGAIGDGATDNTAAFTAAAAYINSTTKGVNLYIPAGEYRFSAGVTFDNTKSYTIYGDGDASILRMNVGTGVPIFTIGAATSQPTRQVIKDLFFQGPVSGSSNGIRLWNANTARVEGCVFQNQITGVQADASYAVELISNVFDVCYTYGFISPTTSCHNLIAERNNFFTCGVLNGGQAMAFNVASDNLQINYNDFEFCNVSLKLANCTAVSFTGNYSEYNVVTHFDFLGTNRNIKIDENWLALGTASTTISNVIGGSLKNNSVFNQTIIVAGTCSDFIVGRNYKIGTGTMPQSAWATPTLSGTFSQQTNYYPAQYIKDENNFVRLRGNLLNGADSSILFTLPVGYRPSLIQTYSGASSAGTGLSTVEVRTNGDVFCIVRSAGGGTGLNGIQFEAAN